MLFNFKIDFSIAKLEDGITIKEVTSVINNNPNHKVYSPGDGDHLMIGYSEKKRIIILSYQYLFEKEREIYDIKVLKSILPDEIYIKALYCKG